nr:zinc finger protein 652-like [Aedes albopictus]
MAPEQPTEECRLCLDTFAECFTWIENPELKEQLEKVFSFPIITEAGFSSSVCRGCWYTISEFYQYSEKVRNNQEVLIRKRVKQEPIDNENIAQDQNHEDMTDELQASSTSNFKLSTDQEPVISHGFESGIKQESNSDDEPEVRSPLDDEHDDTTLNHELQYGDMKVGSSSGEAENVELPEDEHEEADLNYEIESDNSKFQSDSGEAVIGEPSEQEQGEPLLNYDFKCENIKLESTTNAMEIEELSEEEREVAKWYNEFECEDVKIEARSDEAETEKIPKRDQQSSSYEDNSIDPSSESSMQLLKVKTRREEEDQFLSENFTLTCHLCKVVEPTFLMLRDHFRTVHNSYNVYVTCCEEKFGTRGNLISHIKNHDNQLKSKQQGEMLKMTARREQEDQFISQHFILKCHLCKETKPTFESLRNHFRLVHGSYNVYVTCCKKKYGTRSQLINHIKESHIKDEQNQEQPIAEKSIPDGLKLFILKTRREIEDRFIGKHFTLTCYICNVTEPTFQLLRDHFRTVHNSYNVYVTCCGEKFSTRSYLITHIKSHIAERCKPDTSTQDDPEKPPYKCQDCGKIYKNKWHMERHVNMKHRSTDQARVKCDICNHWQLPIDFNTHMRRMHPGYSVCPASPIAGSSSSQSSEGNR